MTTPARILYRLAGSPEPAKKTRVVKVATRCPVCGSTVAVGEEASPYKVALPSSFTDHDILTYPAGTHVCRACAWALGGKPPNTLRLWSWIYREGGDLPPGNLKKEGTINAWALGHPEVWAGSKEDRHLIADLLLDPPETAWACSIADSGQKHVLPFARLNHGGRHWTVRLETQDITSDSATFAALLGPACELYAAGFTIAEIAEGEPRYHTLREAGIKCWRTLNDCIAARRGSPLLDLVLWLLDKEYIDEWITRCGGPIWAAGRRRADAPGCGDGAGAPLVDPPRGDTTPGTLGSYQECTGDGGAARGDLPRARESGGEEAPDRGAPKALGQMDLFDWGGGA